MTKQVAFSDAAYAALRQEKEPTESFSDLALRLLREARIAKKDPMRFVNFPHQRLISAEEHLKEVESGREHDRPDPWQDEAGRKGS
jgi:predicted CopG family antitoxin